MYIKELEERERVLSQNVVSLKSFINITLLPLMMLSISFLADLCPSFMAINKVEELLMEIKETEAEVVRWREACELEVEAGKKEIEERDKMV